MSGPRIGIWNLCWIVPMTAVGGFAFLNAIIPPLALAPSVALRVDVVNRSDQEITVALIGPGTVQTSIERVPPNASDQFRMIVGESTSELLKDRYALLVFDEAGDPVWSRTLSGEEAFAVRGATVARNQGMWDVVLEWDKPAGGHP